MRSRSYVILVNFGPGVPILAASGHLLPEFGELWSGSRDTMQRHTSVIHWCTCN